MGGSAMGGPATEGSAEGTRHFMGGRGGAEGAGHGWLPSLARAVLTGGRGRCRCLGPPPHTPWRSGLCATHPGDTVTIETTALHRVGKPAQCDSSPTCLVRSERRGGGQCRQPPLPGCTLKTARGTCGTRAGCCCCSQQGQGLHAPVPYLGSPWVWAGQHPPATPLGLHLGPPELCPALGRGSPAPAPCSVAPAVPCGQGLPSGPAERAGGSCQELLPVGPGQPVPAQAALPPEAWTQSSELLLICQMYKVLFVFFQVFSKY